MVCMPFLHESLQLYDHNDMWRWWKELFLNVCEKHTLMKTKWTQDSKSPWIITILKKWMNFRDRLKRKTKDPFIWNQSRMVKVTQLDFSIVTPSNFKYNTLIHNTGD